MMMEHPVLLAASLAVVAFFVWQWVFDAKRPAAEPEWRQGYLDARNGVHYLWGRVAMPLMAIGIALFAIFMLGAVVAGGKAVIAPLFIAFVLLAMSRR